MTLDVIVHSRFASSVARQCSQSIGAREHENGEVEDDDADGARDVDSYSKGDGCVGSPVDVDQTYNHIEPNLKGLAIWARQ